MDPEGARDEGFLSRSLMLQSYAARGLTLVAKRYLEVLRTGGIIWSGIPHATNNRSSSVFAAGYLTRKAHNYIFAKREERVKRICRFARKEKEAANPEESVGVRIRTPTAATPMTSVEASEVFGVDRSRV